MGVALVILAGAPTLPWWLPVVAFNLVPLVGVLALGWDLGLILVLYWVENGLVGLSNLPKILAARGDGGPVAMHRVGTAAFFAVHYGLFWAVHGIFVSLIASGAWFGQRADPLVADVGSAPSFWIAVAGLATLRALDLRRWFGDREFERTTPQRQAGEPYRRVVVLHLAIVFGGALVAMLGEPILPLVVLVLVKIGIELRIERRAPSDGTQGIGRPDLSRPRAAPRAE